MKTYGIRPEIEVFDLSMIHSARALADRGLIDERPHIQFVLGVKNALPAERHILDILHGETMRLFPQATFTAAGIGRNQTVVADWSLGLGGHVRTGLEDNVRVSRDRLAASNAELVGIAADQVARHGGRPATVAEARALLVLSAA
jgi:uncharacterized protein (DUF849 family)